MELPLIIDLETKRVLNAIFSGAKQATHSGAKYATIPPQTRPPILLKQLLNPFIKALKWNLKGLIEQQGKHGV